MTSLTGLSAYRRVHSWCNDIRCPQVAEDKANPDINTVLPESGPGFRTYNREQDGQDQVGLASTIDFLENLGREWEPLSDVPFQVGDISRRGGGPFPPHEAHQNGTECDLRPFRKDGAMEPCQVSDPNYDRARTREFMQLVRRLSPNATILFNDSQLIKEGLCRYYKGHHNHLHLGLSRTSPQEPEGC